MYIDYLIYYENRITYLFKSQVVLKKYKNINSLNCVQYHFMYIICHV